MKSIFAFLARPSGLAQDFALYSRFANRPASGSKPAKTLFIFFVFFLNKN